MHPIKNLENSEHSETGPILNIIETNNDLKEVVDEIDGLLDDCSEQEEEEVDDYPRTIDIDFPQEIFDEYMTPGITISMRNIL